MAAHRMTYAATASIAPPVDLTAKVKKTKAMTGTRYIHIIAPYTIRWKIGEDMAAPVGRLSVERNICLIYEIEGGLKYTITYESKNRLVKKYLNGQGRDKNLTSEHVERIQTETDRLEMISNKRLKKSH